MLENVRNSSSQDSQKKFEIFESELKNAQQCLKSPACRQISALPTPPKINENDCNSQTSSSQQKSEETGEKVNTVSSPLFLSAITTGDCMKCPVFETFYKALKIEECEFVH